jgi:hypothetical protein
VSLIELLNRASGGDSSEQGPQIDMQPGLTPADINKFEATLPGKLPGEVRDLLAFSSGFEVDTIGLVDFLGRHPFEFKDAFPRGLPVAGDGDGNFWVQDVREDTGQWDRVFFVSHDPSVVVVQANSLEEFLSQILDVNKPLNQSPLLRVKTDAVECIWKNDPYLVSLEAAISSGDVELSQCAKRLDDGFGIADLRFSEPGSGFSVRGLKTIVMRCGPSPIFAVKNL